MSAGYTTFPVAAINSSLTLLEAAAIKTTRLSLSSAQILTLNSAPVQLLAAPGAGLTYEFFDIIAKYTFATAAYATNVNLRIIFAGGNTSALSNNVILTQTTNSIGMIAKNGYAGNVQWVENAAVNVDIATGNPTGGGGSLILYCAYRIISFT